MFVAPIQANEPAKLICILHDEDWPSDNVVQAILPLRGKILNIERKDEAAMYKNEEIQNLILALGLGVKVAAS